MIIQIFLHIKTENSNFSITAWTKHNFSLMYACYFYYYQNLWRLFISSTQKKIIPECWKLLIFTCFISAVLNIGVNESIFMLNCCNRTIYCMCNSSKMLQFSILWNIIINKRNLIFQLNEMKREREKKKLSSNFVC